MWSVCVRACVCVCGVWCACVRACVVFIQMQVYNTHLRDILRSMHTLQCVICVYTNEKYIQENDNQHFSWSTIHLC